MPEAVETGLPTNADRTAVMRVATEFFSGGETDPLLSGRLRTWVDMGRDLPAREELSHSRVLETAEIVEITDTHAVLEIRGEHRIAITRGSYQFLGRFDGPAILEKAAGEWRITDFTFQGRGRLASVVLGPLAEQEHDGTTVRVLGADRSSYATEFRVEIVNDRDHPISLDRALVLSGGTWGAASVLSNGTIEPGDRATVSLTVGDALDLSQHGISLALRVRAGKRRIPFLLHVPLVRPEEPFRQAPPSRFPVLRASRARTFAFYAVVASLIAWRFGWFALGVPIYVALLYWRHARLYGRLPERLYRVRHALDVLLVAGPALLLWMTPAAELAVPFLIAIFVYLAGARLRASEQARFGAAFSLAATWLFLLGASTGPLSACRLADGRPGDVADSFVRAWLTGDMKSARKVEASWLTQLETLRPPLSQDAAARAIATRRVPSRETPPCDYLHSRGDRGCYAYQAELRGGRRTLWVGVWCDVRHWRIDGVL